MKTIVSPNYMYSQSFDKNIYYEKEKYPQIPECNSDEYFYDLHVFNECSYENRLVDVPLLNPEHYLDIILKPISFVRVFGTVTNKNGEVVRNKKVSIYRAAMYNYKTKYIPVCNVITDEFGLYEAILDGTYCKSHFIIKVWNC
ncbi:MAG: hypothetical protein ACRC2K_12640 [Clostridium sp.]